MKVISTALPDIRVYEPSRFGDGRGYFCEWYNSRTFAAAGLDRHFVQDNHSSPARRERSAACISSCRPPPRQARRVLAGQPLRRGGRLAQRFADLRPPCGVDAHRRAGQAALRPGRLRPRVLHARARHRWSPTRSTHFYCRQAIAVSSGTIPMLAIAWPVESGQIVGADLRKAALADFGDFVPRSDTKGAADGRSVSWSPAAPASSARRSCRHLIAETRPSRSSIVDKLTYAANLDSLAPMSARSALRVRAGRYLRRRRMRAHRSKSFQPDAVMHLAAESHVDRSIDGPARLHRDQRRRHLHRCWKPRAAIGGASTSGRSARLPLPSISPPTRSSARSASNGLFSEDDALRPALALFGQQGGRRPSGARLAPHLRPAGDRHQLLEQLRPLPVSREADPADDHQRARRARAAGLWHGRERARLAPCRGSRARPLSCALTPGKPGREAIISAARSERSNIEVVARSARSSTSLRRRQLGPRERLITLRHGPARARPALRRSTAPRSARARLGSRARPSRAGSRTRCTGISTIAPGGSASAQGRYDGERLGWLGEPP